MFAIETFQLTKIFKSMFGSDLLAVDMIDLKVPMGEVFGLLGPNGAGKTTFIKVLLGITHPTSGSAQILGKDITNIEVKSRIGYLPENHKYPAYLNGEQVLDYYGKLSGVEKSKRFERIDYLLDLVNMEKWRRVKIRKYSKGMMQRLGLAQALINDPDLIFLDEPTDGVDPIGRREIRDILIDLKNKGNTIFLNSHLLSEVELVCTRVAILDKGKLIKDGYVEELTRQSQEYQLKLHGLSEELENELKNQFVFIHHENGFVNVSVENTIQLNVVIDKLRGGDVQIEAIIPKKTSLEDMFVNLIKDK